MYGKSFRKVGEKRRMGNRFGKLVRYDLHYGYQDCRLKWLCALLVQVYFANAAYQGCSMAEGTVSVVGYLTWLFSGMPEYFVVETGRFELPVPWLMLQGCLLFLVGFYPVNDLMHSLGMRQRLGIACAVMEEPELLILDEPFNGLDENGCRMLRELICRYREKGCLILLACHDREELEALSDHIFRVDGGVFIFTR